MRFSFNWLKEWLDISCSAQELAGILTMAGLEVDKVEAAAPAFDLVVIGQIVSIEQHPDADKLKLCKVSVSKQKVLDIVCGASNARAGIKVPVALVGATLPNAIKIGQTAIRGVASFGMLCSEQELGLAETSSGLLELSDDAPVGGRLRKYLDLDDTVIEIDITPNRGDCLGLAGIAREVGVLTQTDRKKTAVSSLKPNVKTEFPVKVVEPEACPVYLGRVISGINPDALTPVWMKERLRRCGIRSLSPVVDVTNYVLLEFGQPMHAFDLEQLEEQIEVRYARKNEPLTLLDGSEIKLDEKTLVIADKKRVLALAGIMGGEQSGISAKTQDLFLECAFFSPRAITGRARQYGLQTDASYRFERGVDPDIQHVAMERATQLILSICGGKAGPVIESGGRSYLPKQAQIHLRPSRIKQVLGVDIAVQQIKDILGRLGMKVSGGKLQGWQVQAPAFRFDISIEVDLIEEIGRVYGYNNIPTRVSNACLTMKSRPENRIRLADACDLLVNRGFQEVITYSFVNEETQQQVCPDVVSLKLANPLSKDMEVMRSSLLPGLLQTVRYNLNRQQSRIAVFETGLVFSKSKSATVQTRNIAGAIAGEANAEQWGMARRPTDFFDCKGHLQALLALACQEDEIEYRSMQHPALHPGQSAAVFRNGHNIGWLGTIHPNIQKKQELSDSVFVFEVDFGNLENTCIPVYRPLSKFPSIRRDLALLVDEGVSSYAICKTIQSTIPDQLQAIKIFDVYRGKGIESGRKSLALGLILQESSRTLVDQEVDAAIEWVVVCLRKELGASLRE